MSKKLSSRAAANLGILALDGETGRFTDVENSELPIAHRPSRRLATSGLHAIAAE